MPRFARIIWRALFLVPAVILHHGLILGDEQPAKSPSGESPISASPAKSSGLPTQELTNVQDLTASAKKSVVVVTFTGRDGQQQGIGTGFIVSKDGLIATNLHVIGEARPIRVELYDGRKFDVISIEATERSQDLVVLKIDAKDLPSLELGNSDDLKEGQPVLAIGNPLGLERSVVTGVLSARREIEGRQMLQIAIPIERGNSGGPLLDLQGKVHGLLTLKSLRTDNLGFAIAVNALKPLLEKPNPIPMSRWLTIGAIDPDEWTVLPGGRWKQRAGQISAEGRAGGFGGRALCLANEPPPEVPYEVAVQVKFTPGDGAAGLVFHADGGDKHYGFYPSNGNVRFSRFDGPDVFSWAVLRETRKPGLNRDGWNLLKVRVEVDRMFCYLNQELVFEIADTTYRAGKVGLCKFRQTDAEFKDFRFGKSLAEVRPADDVADRVTKLIRELKLDDLAETTAIQQLSREDSFVVSTLEQEARHLEARASRLRRVATDVNTQQTLTELRKTLLHEPIDQFHAALLISKLDNPELDLASYENQVQRHARRIRIASGEDPTPEKRFKTLNHYLFEEQGFHGSRTDYGHRSNSYINEVLDDREGLPITLSVLYIELARQLDLKVVGVGMPGHFLVRYEPETGESQLVDVFNRGHLISKEDAQTLFAEVNERSWEDAFLNAISPPAILERMLRNLFSAATETPDIERLLKYTEGVIAIRPDSAEDHLRCAVLCYQTQRWQRARAEIEWLTTHDSNLNRDSIEQLSRAIAQDSQK